MATEKQKRFARLIANGCDENNDPVTATDAYTLAGYKELFPRNAQRVEACRLLASKTIGELIDVERKIISQNQEKIRKKQELLVLSDSQRVLDKLRTWIDGEIEATSSQLRSAELLARVSGMMRTDISIESKERSSSEIESLLEAKLASIAEISNEFNTEDVDELPDHKPVH